VKSVTPNLIRGAGGEVAVQQIPGPSVVLGRDRGPDPLVTGLPTSVIYASDWIGGGGPASSTTLHDMQGLMEVF
jgi:hypothetical protein